MAYDIRQGDTVECVDSWDTFKNLTVGKLYGVTKVKGGFVFVIGDSGHEGGWYPFKFKLSEAALNQSGVS